MSTTEENINAHLDPATRFWLSGGGHSTPIAGRFDDLDDDMASVKRETTRRAENAADDEAARPWEEELARISGTQKAGYENADRLNEGYRADPISTREWHKRAYASRLPDTGPPPAAPKAEPPADLDERGRDEWHLHQCAREGYHGAEKEAEFRRQREEAAPIREKLRQNFGPLAKFAEIATGVHAAMSANPAVADRIARMYGAPVDAAHAAEMVQAAHEQQHAAALGHWLETEQQLNSFPGLEKPEVESVVCRVLEHMNATGQRTPVDPQNPAVAYRQDLTTAYHYAVQSLQQQAQPSQDRAAAERAKHASRSLSGGSPASAPATDDGPADESVEDTVRRVMRGRAA